MLIKYKIFILISFLMLVFFAYKNSGNLNLTNQGKPL